MTSVKPNYKEGSIVNLMSSIQEASGVNSIYNNLKHLPKKELAHHKNIVLFVIDGLGYNFLKKYGKNSELNKHLSGKITSIYPSTTAAAITTFNTGVAPQQHACTGWFMHLKEIATTSIMLRFMPRHKGMTFSKLKLTPKELLYPGTIFDKFNRQVYLINHKDIVKSDYNNYYSANAKTESYSNLRQLFDKTNKIISKNGKKYVYAYWPYFDTYSHEKGPEHKATLKHFKQIDVEFSRFLKKVKSNTIVIVTADHGHLEIPKKNVVFMKDHPRLDETLTIPLTGDARFAYAYVKPSKVKEFKDYFKHELKGKFDIIKSEDAIKKGFFGLGTPNKKLYDRVGDFIIIGKENYCIEDCLRISKPSYMIGYHAGVSADEMLVPLIVVRK